MDLDNILPFSIIDNSDDKIRLTKDVTVIFNKNYDSNFLNENDIINGFISTLVSTLDLIRKTFIFELQDSSNPIKQLEIYKWISNLYIDNELFNENSYETLLSISKEASLGSEKKLKKIIKKISKELEITLEKVNLINAETTKKLYDQVDSKTILTNLLHHLKDDKFNIELKYPKEKSLISLYNTLIFDLDMKIKHPIKLNGNPIFKLEDLFNSKYKNKAYKILNILKEPYLGYVDDSNIWTAENKYYAQYLYEVLKDKLILKQNKGIYEKFRIYIGDTYTNISYGSFKKYDIDPYEIKEIKTLIEENLEKILNP